MRDSWRWLKRRYCSGFCCRTCCALVSLKDDTCQLDATAGATAASGPGSARRPHLPAPEPGAPHPPCPRRGSPRTLCTSPGPTGPATAAWSSSAGWPCEGAGRGQDLRFHQVHWFMENVHPASVRPGFQAPGRAVDTQRTRWEATLGEGSTEPPRGHLSDL